MTVLQLAIGRETLLLRAPQPSDAENLYRAIWESKAELMAWMPWCHAAYSVRDAEQWLAGLHDATDDGERPFVIVDESTGQILGGTGLNQIDPINRRANLGYWVRTAACGRGIATAAARRVAKYAFETLDIERIEIVAAVENRASQRVAEKLGASREGILRRRMRVGDTQHDAVSYSLVRGEA